MSSVSRGLAQRLTKQLVVLAAGEAYTQAQLETAIDAYVKSGNVYLVADAAAFQADTTAITALTGTAIAVGDSLIDLGKDLYLGIAGLDSQLIQFRLVQPLNGTVANSGVNSAGLYVVVKSIKTYGLPVAVARV